MAVIDTLFIEATTKQALQEKLDAGDIQDFSIVFINETGEIYARGNYFKTNEIYDLVAESIAGDSITTTEYQSIERAVNNRKLIILKNEEGNRWACIKSVTTSGSITLIFQTSLLSYLKVIISSSGTVSKTEYKYIENDKINSVYIPFGTEENEVCRGSIGQQNTQSINIINTAIGDISDLNTTAEDIVSAINEVKSQVGSDYIDLEARVAANENKLMVVQGEETIDGSIKKALKDAKDYTNAKIAWAIIQ